ncbi:ubiquitin [Onthophagus taurus]|uniref:ubiquitin n=1 Tax=Onthophagus taurus TaxID=166361 RepID=UPI000C20EBB1|nr:ubiquitin-like protein 4A [Onthophagus taurus]
MKIFIKVIRGDGCIMEVHENTKIREVKKQIETDLKVPTAQQTLILYGKPLLDEKTISFYPLIKDGTKLHLVIKKPESLNVVLARFFKNYYTEDQTNVIIEEFMKDFQEKVRSLSLDDLERIATSYLNDEGV